MVSTKVCTNRTGRMVHRRRSRIKISTETISPAIVSAVRMDRTITTKAIIITNKTDILKNIKTFKRKYTQNTHTYKCITLNSFNFLPHFVAVILFLFICLLKQYIILFFLFLLGFILFV